MATAKDDSFLPAVDYTPEQILLEPKKFESFISGIKAELAKIPVDLTSEKGRKNIASAAYKVAKTKTAIDTARKDLTKEWREKINKVNETGGGMVDQLQALQDETRKPLTEWEEAESAKETAAQRITETITKSTVILLTDTPDTLQARIADLEALTITEEVFGDHKAHMTDAMRKMAMQSLQATRERLVKDATERAELEQLRAQKAEMEAAVAQAQADLAAEKARAAQALAAEAAKAEKLIAEAAAKAAAPPVPSSLPASLDPRRHAFKALVAAAEHDEVDAPAPQASAADDEFEVGSATITATPVAVMDVDPSFIKECARLLVSVLSQTSYGAMQERERESYHDAAHALIVHIARKIGGRN